MKKNGSSINVDKNIDNLFLLISSTSDVFNGLISYLYFKILNMTPIEYFNIEIDDVLTQEDIDVENDEFEKYDNWIFSKNIQDDINGVLKTIREESVNENVLKKVGDYYLINNYDKYNYAYIFKKIYNYYKKK